MTNSELVAGDRMTMSNAHFERACLYHIKELTLDENHDASLLNVLCEAVRVVREYNGVMMERRGLIREK